VPPPLAVPSTPFGVPSAWLWNSPRAILLIVSSGVSVLTLEPKVPTCDSKAIKILEKQLGVL